MRAKVEHAWRGLGTPAPGVVVAVSGGPDSVALLHALSSLRNAADGPLVVAHLNHQLRGAESDDDEAFVRELAAARGVAVVCHRLDMAALVRAEGGNLEALARRERYRWLAEVAREQGLRFVVTGHTASDQAETVLHRVLRGTGLEGLRGIAPRRRLTDGVELVRPLLEVTRREVLDYLTEVGQPARQDASNEDRRFTRNRIRHELLPLLAREYNPRVEEVLARLARLAEEWATEDQEEAAGLLERTERGRERGLVLLDAEAFGGVPRRRIRSALRLLWRREGWPMLEMGLDHWDGATAVCLGEPNRRDLPGGVRIERRGVVVRVGREEGS